MQSLRPVCTTKRVEEDTVDGISLKSLVLGFVAGAIAVVTAHEIINYILHYFDIFPRVPWSMTPAAMTGVPQIVSDAFWGGLWGVLFVLISDKIPGGNLTVKGLIFGILGPCGSRKFMRRSEGHCQSKLA